jgi:16S rRNA (cytosine1407-C5)-methyltransferase
VATRLSEDFLEHAKQTYLPESQFELFVQACKSPLRKSIRVNTLKSSVEKVIQLLQSLGYQLSPIPWCEQGFWVERNATDTDFSNAEWKDVQLGNIAEHIQGLFYIQEASSMLPPLALLANSISSDISFDGCLTLDMAASPGSKTTQIAALQNNQGILIANELSASRVKVLHANLVRCGIVNTCMTQFDGRKLGKRLDGKFDFVLLDAPCGGEGTVRKDPQALENWNLQTVQSIAELQKQLIETAYQCLKPGGKLVYSTCTLSPEENQQVAAHLVATTDAMIQPLENLFEGADKALTAEGYLHVLPHIYDSEGFFVAAFDKPLESATSDYLESANQPEKSPFQPAVKKVSQQLLDYYRKHFGFAFPTKRVCLFQRDKEVWLFPRHFEEISQLVRFNRSGIKLAEIYPNKIRSSFEFIIAFGAQFAKQKLEVNLSQMEEFLKGRNLDCKTTKTDIEGQALNDGEVVLMYQGNPIGIGSLQKGKIKNQLPRDLVRDHIELKQN